MRLTKAEKLLISGTCAFIALLFAFSVFDGGGGPVSRSLGQGFTEVRGEFSPVKPYLIDINTAARDELEELPGIGPALADRIIEYRTEHGGFKTPEEILNVSGVGEAKYQGFYELIKA